MGTWFDSRKQKKEVEKEVEFLDKQHQKIIDEWRKRDPSVTQEQIDAYIALEDSYADIKDRCMDLIGAACLLLAQSSKAVGREDAGTFTAYDTLLFTIDAHVDMLKQAMTDNKRLVLGTDK